MSDDKVAWWEQLLAANRASVANQCAVCRDYRRQLLAFAKSKGDEKELARDKARKRGIAHKSLKKHLQADSNHPTFVPLVPLPTRSAMQESNHAPAAQPDLTQAEQVFLRQLNARTEESKTVHFVGPSAMGSNSSAGREARRSDNIDVLDYCVVRGDTANGSPPWWIGQIYAVSVEYLAQRSRVRRREISQRIVGVRNARAHF